MVVVVNKNGVHKHNGAAWREREQTGWQEVVLR